MVSSKHAFWQALVFTIIVFAIGILLGFFLEGSRTDDIELRLLNSEINLLDEQIRVRGVGRFDVDCELARESTFLFADDIYGEVRQLELYDSKAKLDDSLRILHRRYDLLRMMLWMESMDLKEKCSNDFHTIVYFFNYATKEIDVQAKQASLSRLLLDLKEKHGNEILLIPIAGNLELHSVELVLERYGVSELPVIIVDEEKLIRDVVTLSELENTVFEGRYSERLEDVIFERYSPKTRGDFMLNINK